MFSEYYMFLQQWDNLLRKKVEKQGVKK